MYYINMTESTVNLGNIPSIWSSQIWANSTQNQKTFWKPDVAMFDNAPSDVTLWSFFWKVFIWLIVWLCVVALLFWTLAALGSITWSDSGEVNSMLKILLSVVWFVVHFVWSLALALMYNIFFSKRYYNFGKMFALIFVSSLILWLFFVVIYVLYDKINDLYVVLWFQVIFWLYVSLNLMDFLSQPNYSASSMMANNLWCIITIVAYISIMQMVDFTTWENLKLKSVLFLAILPVILSYTLMIFGANVWDAIYYKFYEWWNNPFYLPSLSELREERQKEEKEKEKEDEDVNVEMK
jgi:hypothetical protein